MSNPFMALFRVAVPAVKQFRKYSDQISMANNEKLEFVKKHICSFPDYPEQGILFRDIFSAVKNGEVCKHLKDLLVHHVKQDCSNVEVIVGLESRGFLFNLMLAAELGIGCVPIRKKGKLPGNVLSIEYKKEYGPDVFEMQRDAIKPGQKVIIVDDLVATGGSLKAAVDLVKRAGGVVLEALVVIELTELEARSKIGCDLHSLIKYNSDDKE